MDAFQCVHKLVYGRIKAWKQTHKWIGYINHDVYIMDTAVKNNEDADYVLT